MRCAAYFYAAQAADESILGLCSDDENQLLAAADTQGIVSLWDISNLGVDLNDKDKGKEVQSAHSITILQFALKVPPKICTRQTNDLEKLMITEKRAPWQCTRTALS